MNTDILTNNSSEFQPQNNMPWNIVKDSPWIGLAASDTTSIEDESDELETTKPQMLEVVAKDFQGKQLIID
jgi:hypothetical protein